MIAKLLLQNLIWVAGIGALLGLSAGTLRWPAAWAFLATITISGVSGGLWLARTDPDLLAERMRPMMLGSRWGVLIAPLFAALFAIRTRIEERALLAGLPGYADYAARVGYRLLPGFW